MHTDTEILKDSGTVFYIYFQIKEWLNSKLRCMFAPRLTGRNREKEKWMAVLSTIHKSSIHFIGVFCTPTIDKEPLFELYDRL